MVTLSFTIICSMKQPSCNCIIVTSSVSLDLIWHVCPVNTHWYNLQALSSKARQRWGSKSCTHIQICNLSCADIDVLCDQPVVLSTVIEVTSQEVVIAFGLDVVSPLKNRIIYTIIIAIYWIIPSCIRCGYRASIGPQRTSLSVS